MDNLWDSAFDFERVVWPAIQQTFPGARVVPVEGGQEEASQVVDQVGGIDAWVVTGDTRLQGIASRVQYGAAWDSFTIRARTAAGNVSELDKRLDALRDRDNHLVVPHYTVQAYVEHRRTGRLILALMIQTEDLFGFMKVHPALVVRRRNRADGAEFVVVWADDLREARIQVWNFAGQDVIEWKTRDGWDGIDLRGYEDQEDDDEYGDEDEEDEQRCWAWDQYSADELCPYCHDRHWPPW